MVGSPASGAFSCPIADSPPQHSLPSYRSRLGRSSRGSNPLGESINFNNSLKLTAPCPGCVPATGLGGYYHVSRSQVAGENGGALPSRLNNFVRLVSREIRGTVAVSPHAPLVRRRRPTLCAARCCRTASKSGTAAPNLKRDNP